MRSAHPAPAAAGSRLDHHRVASFLAIFIASSSVSTIPSLPGVTGTPALRAAARAAFLSPIDCIAREEGPDELDVAAFADFHEMRVLSEEPIPGMNRVNVADLGRAHDSINFQITLKAGRRADADRFIGELDMERIDVCFE
jgi:hypothetical protein